MEKNKSCTFLGNVLALLAAEHACELYFPGVFFLQAVNTSIQSINPLIIVINQHRNGRFSRANLISSKMAWEIEGIHFWNST